MRQLLFSTTGKIVTAILVGILAGVVGRLEPIKIGYVAYKFGGLNSALFLVLAGASALLVLSSLMNLLLELYRQKGFSLPAGTAERLRRFSRGARRAIARPGFQISFWCFVIAIVVGVSMKGRFLGDMGLKAVQILPPSKKAEKEESKVVIMSLGSPDNNTKNYVSNCLTVARDLKEAGAKAVLIEAPIGGTSYLYSEDFRKLNEIGTVVLSFPDRSDYMVGYITRGEFELTKGFTTLEKIPPFIYRINLAQPSVFPEGKINADISLELLRKYYGYSKDIPAIKEEAMLRFGGLEFPLNSRGFFLIGKPTDPSFERIHASYGFTSLEPLKYGTSLGTSASLSDFRATVEGKIVILASWQTGKYSLEIRDYAFAIHQMLRGGFLKESNIGTVALVFLAIMLCGFLYWKAGSIARFGGITALTALLGLVTAWLYHEHNLVIDFAYVLEAVIFCVGALTPLRVAHEWALTWAAPDPLGL